MRMMIAHNKAFVATRSHSFVKCHEQLTTSFNANKFTQNSFDALKFLFIIFKLFVQTQLILKYAIIKFYSIQIL